MGEYSDLFNEDQETNLSLRLTSGDPEQASKSRQLAKKYNIPPALVEQFPDDYKQREQADKNSAALEGSAGVKKWFDADPYNIKVSHDDVPNLALTDRAIRGFGEYVLRPIGGEGVGRLNQGVYGALAAAVDTLDYIPRKLTGAPSSDLSDLLHAQATAGARRADELGIAAGDYGTVGRGVASGISSLWNSLLVMPIGAELQGQKALTQIGASVLPSAKALAPMGVETAGQSFQEGHEAGLSLPQNLAYSASQGAVEMVTEALPFGETLHMAKGGSPLLKALGRVFVEENVGEQVATHWQDLNSWLNLHPEKTLDDYFAERPDAALQTLIATSFSAGLQTTAMHLATRANREDQKAQTTIKQTDFIAQVNELAQASKIAQRDADSFQDFVDKASEDGPVTDVYIDAETFAQSGVADQIAEVSPATAEQLAPSLASGGMIRIPLSEYVARIAPNPELSGPLLEHLKVDPMGFSSAEAKEYVKTQGAEMEAEITRALQGQQADVSFKASQDAVKQSVLDNLNAVGRNTPGVNEAYASLIAARTAVRAAQLGLTPEQMFQKQLLRVQGDTAQGDALNQPAKLTAESVSAFADEVKQRHNLKDFDLALRSNGDISLNMIEVPKDGRKQGVGTAVIQELVKLADKNGHRIVLSLAQPSDARGTTSVARLEKFYKGLGFVKNKGKNKNFAISDGMYREPSAGPVIGEQQDIAYVNGVESPKRAYSADQLGLPFTDEDAKQLAEIETRADTKAEQVNAGLNAVRSLLHARDYRAGASVLASSIPQDFISNGSTELIGQRITTPGDLATLAQVYRDPRFETFRVFFTKGDEIVHQTGITSRLPSAVHFAVPKTKTTRREMADEYINTIRSAMAESGADGYYLLHNHPSGSAKPSQADIRSTEYIQIRIDGFKGHVIIDQDQYTELYDSERVNTYDMVSGGYKIGENPFGKSESLGALIKDPKTLAAATKGLQVAKDMAVIIGLSSKGMVNVIAEYPVTLLSEDGLRPTARIAKLMRNSGAVTALAVLEDRSKISKLLDAGLITDAVRPDYPAGGAYISERDHSKSMEREAVSRGLGRSAPRAIFAEGGSYVYGQESVSDKLEKLYQEKRGSYSPSQNIISLLKDADLSTVLHETGHYFFENDIALANELLAKPELTAGEQAIVDDVSALLKWHGFEGTPDEQVDQWNQLSFEQKRQHHERTAEAFESYLFSGKSPSIELAPYFQRFREFLLNVYKSIKQFLSTHPEAGKLNDEVRGVFDRMLATDEQIKLAEQGRSMLPLFKTAAEAEKFGVDFEQYQALAKDSTQQAIETLQAQGLKDMQWLHNAHGREVAKLKKQSDALRREVRMQVRGEVMSEPVYRAWRFLTAKLDEHDKPAKPEAKSKGLDPTQDSLFVAIAKLGGLNKEEVMSTWGVETKFNDNQVFGKPLLRKEGRSIDGMLEVLAENGYLTLDENGKADTAELAEKFDNELRGKQEYSWQKDFTPEGQLANPDALTAGRLDAGDIASMDIQPEMVRRLNDFKMVAKNGLNAELIAQMHGFSSADAMIRALYLAETPQNTIEKVTDDRMLAEHSNLATPEAIAKEADKALYNKARGKMLLADANALAKAASADVSVQINGKKRTVNILPKVAKQFADKLIAAIRIRDLRPAQYEAAEIKAGKATEKAKNSGDLDAAAGHARTRLINFYAAKSANEVLEEIDTAVKYLRKVQEPGKIPANHHDQIVSILSKFNLRNQSNAKLDNVAMFSTWAKSQLEAGNIPPNVELLLTPEQRKQYARELAARNEDGELIYADEEKQAELLASMLDQTPVRNYRELTVEELRGLVDTIKQIEHIGKRTKKVLTDRKKREFASVVNTIRDRIVEVATKKGRKSTDTYTPTDSMAKKLLSWRGFWGSHIKTATQVNIMDGGEGGPMWEHLVQTANEAGNGEVVDSAAAYQEIEKLLKPVKEQGPITGKPVYFPSIGRSLNRQERLAMALNLGNESNEQRLLGGQGWTRAQIQPVLDTLTETDWNYVQGMWNLYESYRPRVAEMERLIAGAEPEWIDARPMQVKTADGKTLDLRGGYAPVIYDPRASGKAASFAAEKDAKAMMQAARVASTVNKSFTKSRVTEVKGRPLLMSLDAMHGAVQDTIHYLHWQPWIIDANRLVKALDEPMREHYGAETVSQIRAWVGDNAAGVRPSRDGAERAITNLARNVSFAGLAFNVFSAVQQVTGYSQSVAVVGSKWMAKGVAKTLASPRKAFTEAAEKSSFMRKRGMTRMREIAETNQIVKDQGKVRSALDQTGYAMMLAMQSAVDVPTWWGAYEKALDSGYDEHDAVAQADQAVITSQGSGMAKDLAMVERANGALRLLTGFMSFMNTTLNLNYRIAKSDQSVGQKAADLVLVNAIPVIVTMALKALLFGGGDDDKEKDAGDYAKEYAAEQFSFMFGQMLGFREVSQIGAAALGLPTYGYQGAVGTRAFADTMTLAKQLGQGEMDDALRKSLINAAGDFLRLPSSQLNRTITGTEALLSDETDNPAAIAFGYRK